MRIFPIITALLVMSALYLLVFEREKIVSYATGGSANQTQTVLDAANSSDPEVPPSDEKLISVVAINSQARDIASAVLLRGQTEAARQVDVRSETAGLIISEPLRKGTHVTAGQMLCQLDPGTREVSLDEAIARLAEAKTRVPEALARQPEAQARLAEAKARVVEAEINLRAAKRLSEDGFASETRVASAQAAHESATASVQAAMSGVASSKSGTQGAAAGIQSAQAGVAAAMREIDRLTISAPFAGLLESDAAEIGSFLQPGALCATVIQLDPIKLVGFVPETDVGRIQVGVAAGARLVTGDEVQGKVTFLSHSADSTTRTFRVEIQVPNSDLAIRDGQTAEILISSAGEAAHLLPSSALTLNDRGDLGIRAVDETNHVKFVPVRVLRDTVDGIWVAGLSSSVDVIVVGQEYVIEGVAVKVAYQEASQ
ncbi:MAG: efflux RND transporter periplasmic adaptor subunit [Paracoccaceae bacterium]